MQKQENFELILKGYLSLNNNILPTQPTQNQNVEVVEDLKLIKGSLRFRTKQKIYEARIMLNGNRKSFYSINKNDCIQKANAFYRENYKTLKITYNKKTQTFNEWIDEWFELYKSKTIKKSSQASILSAVNLYIKPYFKNFTLKQINALQVDKFLNTFENSRHKETVSTTICDILRTAYKKEKIKKPVHEQFEHFKHKRKQGNCLTVEQEQILLEQLDNVENSEIIRFCYLTGCRKHGAVNLVPSDIDFENNLIHIRETKTAESDRLFPMFPELKTFLKSLDLTKNKVFNISDRKLRQVMNELVDKCGFKFLIKDLRTSFATRSIEKGIVPEMLKRLMGHTSYQTTSKYYIKLRKDYEQKQIELL